MERWESIYFDILSRLQKVCDGLGISMWLSGRAALGAYRDGRLTGSDVNVLVNAKDAMRLAEALAECSDETFGSESMLSNSRYPRFEIRVFDPRTTDCDTSEFFRIENNCMHVTVLFLQRDVNKGCGLIVILKSFDIPRFFGIVFLIEARQQSLQTGALFEFLFFFFLVL